MAGTIRGLDSAGGGTLPDAAIEDLAVNIETPGTRVRGAVDGVVGSLPLTTAAEAPEGNAAEWFDENGDLMFAIDGIGTPSPRLRGSVDGNASGVVVHPSGDTTGATDTSAVNTALQSSPLVILAPGQWHQNDAFIIPSGTRLHCEGPFESFLAAGSNSNLVTNEITEATCTNVALTGTGHVRFNGNAANQTRLDGSPDYAGWKNIGIHFVNVDGLFVQNITWANTAMFGALCVGVRRAWWKDNRVEQDFAQPNQDGLDIGPACHDIWIDGLTGNTEDDVHSIFAKYSTSQKTVHPLYLPADANYVGWPAGALYSAAGNSTHDIHVSRSHVNAGKNFFRLQAAEGSQLYDVTGQDIRHTGTTACRALAIFGEMIDAYITSRPATDGSDFRNITFDGFRGRVESLFYMDSHVRDVVARGVHLEQWTAFISQKSATDTPSEFRDVTIDGVTATAGSATGFANLVTVTGGMVARNVQIQNVNIPGANRIVANTDSTVENISVYGHIGAIAAGAFYIAGTGTTTGRFRINVDTAVADMGTVPAVPAGAATITNEVTA